MRIGKFGVALGSVALVVSVFVTTARAADSNVGTWKVNLAKSTYDPGPPPKGPNVTKIEADGDGIKGDRRRGQRSGTSDARDLLRQIRWERLSANRESQRRHDFD